MGGPIKGFSFSSSSFSSSSILIFLSACCLLLSYLPPAAVGVNLAVGKKIRDCHRRVLSEKLVDGIPSENEFFSVSRMCTGASYVEVDLVMRYFVHYVVVYPGMGSSGSSSGSLDFFIVRQYLSGNFIECGEHSGPVLELFIGYRVNCRILIETPRIRIESRKTSSLVLNEIEVHSLAEYRIGLLIYRGCFKSFNGTKKNAMDLTTCHKWCSFYHYFMAVKGGEYCHCGDDVDKAAELTDIFCNLRCPNMQGKGCGGVKAYSVYLVKVYLPHHMGCFNRGAITERSSLSGADMEVKKCLVHCQDQTYAMLWNGNKCGCTTLTSFNLTTASYRNCQVQCSGSSVETCGSPSAASVLLVCQKISCSRLMHCAHGYDKNGACIGGCSAGFKGVHCLERVRKASLCEIFAPCRKYEGAACIVKDEKTFECYCHDRQNKTSTCRDLPFTECNVSIARDFLCICDLGFYRDENQVCVEIDLCLSEPCKAAHSYCVNERTSYECPCVQGYHVTAEGNCTKTRTCKGMSLCDNRTTICRETELAYDCPCRAGFIPTTTYQCMDEDECRNASLVCHKASCVNTYGSFYCVCESGMVMAAVGLIHSCVDRNECEELGCKDANAFCINIRGGFACFCRPGFVEGHGPLCELDTSLKTTNLLFNELIEERNVSDIMLMSASEFSTESSLAFYKVVFYFVGMAVLMLAIAMIGNLRVGEAAAEEDSDAVGHHDQRRPRNAESRLNQGLPNADEIDFTLDELYKAHKKLDDTPDVKPKK